MTTSLNQMMSLSYMTYGQDVCFDISGTFFAFPTQCSRLTPNDGRALPAGVVRLHFFACTVCAAETWNPEENMQC